MTTLLNKSRPPVFCPGCSHDRVLQTLDQTLVEMGYSGSDIVIVTDIGCSGLFDTFFNTHAFHGLHGRALTYATGIKLARPDLKVIVTMGDGGLGIGGAHVLSTCRRNIDLTLLVLNNFNYGMTGGQCSSTTHQEAVVGSGFLNRLEKPIDICQVAGAAGAGMVLRTSTYQKDLGERLQEALNFDGFSLLDIWGICPGRYTRRNKLTPKAIAADLGQRPDLPDFQSQNARVEYGKAYRKEVAKLTTPKNPLAIKAACTSPQTGRQEAVILGGAGQCSSTTPQEAVVGSGFLNRLEKPIDICQVAGAAGAGMVLRTSTYQKDLGERLQEALNFDGFSLLDIWGICPGRYTRRNKLTPKAIAADLGQRPDLPDFQSQNARVEYGKAYRKEVAKLTTPKNPLAIKAACTSPQTGRQEAVILGGAGQRIITAGELLCLAGASAGCHATQKNDYPITVMKGHSVSEIILADEEIDYTGIENPAAVIALAPEGVNRRKKMLANLPPETVVIKTPNVELHPCPATIIEVDFKAQKIRPQDWALAALAVLAKQDKILTMEMLTAALKLRFQETIYKAALDVIKKISAINTKSS